jgi:hypothetical protein
MTPPLGIFPVHDASGVPGVLELARRADAGGLDLRSTLRQVTAGEQT